MHNKLFFSNSWRDPHLGGFTCCLLHKTTICVCPWPVAGMPERNKRVGRRCRFRRVIIFVDCRRFGSLARSVRALSKCVNATRRRKNKTRKQIVVFFSLSLSVSSVNVIFPFLSFFSSLFERITQRVTRCSRLSTVALPAAATAGQL